MKKNLIHGTMALLFVLVVCISSAAAVNDTVTRDLPDSASAGASITVNLTVDVQTSAGTLLVDEVVPSGLTVTSATNEGDYNTTAGHVFWTKLSGVANATYSYTVDVPADASGTYTFGGTYMFEGMADTATILGDTTVNVGDVDTVTRDLPASASADAPITVNLTVDVQTSAGTLLVDEVVPSGLTVTSATNEGDYNTTAGHVFWTKLSGVAGATYSYTVDVPADASDAYTFGGTYMFEGMADTATILGDTTLTVGAVTPTLTTFTVTPASVVQGGTVEIDIAFSTAVSWVINVNNSTATVKSWSGASTNPAVKDWVIATATPTGTYTVDVFMNGALADTETVTVTEAGVDDTVTRDLPANTSAGATITVDLAVDVETGAGTLLIDEVVPSGLTVTSATNEGDYNTTAGHVFWTKLSGVTDATYSYTVEVPADASGTCTFSGTYAFEGMTGEAATILGDTTLTIGVAPSITISPPSCGLIVGGSLTFTAVCKDTNSDVMTCPTLTWDSSNETVGTITSAGVFTASAVGTTTITASAEGMTSNDATVTVYPTGAVIVTLYEGWNLIAVPVNDPDANTAAGLASKITGCKEVVKWDASTQTYDPYVKFGETWTGTDFAITGGTGIFVNMEGATTVGFTGDAWS